MKFLSTLLFAGLLSLPAYAQNGFYFSPSAGAGIGSSTMSIYSIGLSGTSSTNSRVVILSTNLQLGIGYQHKNWRFQSGLQYFQSGYKIKDLTFGSDFDPNNPAGSGGTGSYKITINQVAIPLQVAYTIPLGNRFSLVPHIGALAAYTFSGTSRIDGNGGVTSKSLSGAALNDYGRFTFWGQAGVQLEYKLSDKISLFGGPSAQYMLGGTGNNNEKNFYNIHFNLGLKIELGKGGGKAPCVNRLL